MATGTICDTARESYGLGPHWCVAGYEQQPGSGGCGVHTHVMAYRWPGAVYGKRVQTTRVGHTPDT